MASVSFAAMATSHVFASQLWLVNNLLYSSPQLWLVNNLLHSSPQLTPHRARWSVLTSLNLATCGCNGIPFKLPYTHTFYNYHIHTHSDYDYPKIPVNTLVCLDTRRLAANLNRVLAVFGIPSMQRAVWSLWIGAPYQLKTTKMFWHNRWDVHAYVRAVLQSCLQKNAVYATITSICSIYIRSGWRMYIVIHFP